MTKQLVAWMLLSIATATSVSAQTLNLFDGLGRQRPDLSPKQIETRSERLEMSTTFSLLRYPDALKAPARIFKPDIWQAIERAARANDLDPMVLAGMIFVESYGDPLAKSPTGPAGIAQLTRSSARELGLAVDKRVRVGSRTITKTSVVGKGKNRRRVTRTVRQPVYKTVDDRYVPERAIGAMARRLSNRRAWLGGRLDFAIAEYHMGAGRMARLLSSYLGRAVSVAHVRDEMADADMSYATLYWTNTPYFRPAVYSLLENLNGVDFSPTYYFRVKRAAQLLQMYRESPGDYARLAARLQGGPGQPPSLQLSFLNQTTGTAPVRSAYEAQLELGDRFVLLPETASAAGVRSRPAPSGSPSRLAAERSTIGAALFVARQLRLLQGDSYTGFEIERMLSHDTDEEAAQRVHGLGWAFDIPTTSLSPSAQRDLRFILTDLRQAGLLVFTVEDGRAPTFHVVRHPDHAELFEQFYWDVVGGAVDTGVSSGVG